MAGRMLSFQTKDTGRPQASDLDFLKKLGLQRLKKVGCSAQIPHL
jgi:hypothetical protein